MMPSGRARFRGGVVALGACLVLGVVTSAGAGKLFGRSPSTRTLGFAPRSAFDFELDTTITADGGQVLTQYKLRGDLELRTRSLGNGQRVVRMVLLAPKLSDVNFSDANGSVPEEFLQAFTKPCFVEQDAHGAVTGIRFTRGSPSFAQTTWKAVAGLMQLVAPSDSGQATWDTLESDAAGEYSASYERAPGGVLLKHKRAYTKPGGQMPAQENVVVSDARFELDHDTLVKLHVHDSVRAVPPSPWPTMTSDVRFALAPRTPDPSADGDATSAEFLAAQAFKLGDPVSADARRADEDRVRARGADLDEVLRQAQTGEEKDRLKAYKTLVSLLRSDPPTANRVDRAAHDSNDLGRWVIAGLGDAGTEPAQAELAKLLGDESLASEQRLSALQALGRVEAPTPATVAAVTALRNDDYLGFQAKLSIGSIAYRLQERQPAQASTLLQLLLSGLASRAGRPIATQYLKAIGNAGSPASLPTLIAELSGAEPTQRAAAALALRRIRDPRVEGLLIGALADSNQDVKCAALEAVRQQGPSAKLVSAVAKLVRDSAEPSAQSTALSVIGNWGPAAKTTEVEQDLHWLIDHEAGHDLAESAERALEQVRGTG